MKNPRYDYLPIINRKKVVWPNDGRIALWVAPNIEYFHFDMPIRGSGSNHAPDVPGYTLRAEPQFDEARESWRGHARVAVFLEVLGADGHDDLQRAEALHHPLDRRSAARRSRLSDFPG